MAESCDAIVIGGGVIGASVLFHLTRLGCPSALLLERGGPCGRHDGIFVRHRADPLRVPVNVQVARASLAVFESFRDLLDGAPEAESGLLRRHRFLFALNGGQTQNIVWPR